MFDGSDLLYYNRFSGQRTHCYSAPGQAEIIDVIVYKSFTQYHRTDYYKPRVWLMILSTTADGISRIDAFDLWGYYYEKFTTIVEVFNAGNHWETNITQITLGTIRIESTKQLKNCLFIGYHNAKSFKDSGIAFTLLYSPDLLYFKWIDLWAKSHMWGSGITIRNFAFNYAEAFWPNLPLPLLYYEADGELKLAMLTYAKDVNATSEVSKNILRRTQGDGFLASTSEELLNAIIADLVDLDDLSDSKLKKILFVNTQMSQNNPTKVNGRRIALQFEDDSVFLAKEFGGGSIIETPFGMELMMNCVIASQKVKNFKYQVSKQDYDGTCWSASLRDHLHFLSGEYPDISECEMQEKFVAASKGKGCCIFKGSISVCRGAKPQIIRESAKFFGLEARNLMPLSFEEIKSYVHANVPISFLSVMMDTGKATAAHAMTIVGYATPIRDGVSQQMVKVANTATGWIWLLDYEDLFRWTLNKKQHFGWRQTFIYSKI